MGALRLTPRARQTLEIAGGLLTANLGDLANTALISLALPLLLGSPHLLALIPVLAALRGSVVMSMASRTTTGLYLGGLEPTTGAVVRVEALRTLSLALLSALYGGLLVAFVGGYPWERVVGVSVASALLALLVLLPVTSLVITVGYRRNLNPDNFTAPILTVLGDVSTVPSLVAAALLTGEGGARAVLLSVAAIFLSLQALHYTLLSRPQDRRIIGEALAALLLVGLIESGAGGLYAGLSGALATLGVVHVVPSIMEDVGASLSVYASRLTTRVNLAGLEAGVRGTPRILLEVAVGSVPSMLALSTIGVVTSGLAGLSVGLLDLLPLVALTWLGLLGLTTPIVLVLVWASARAGLDPDNMVIPLITSIVDLSVVPFLVYVAGPLAG